MWGSRYFLETFSLLTCQSHSKVRRKGRYLHILRPSQPHWIRHPEIGEILHWNSEEHQHIEEIRHDGGDWRTEGYEKWSYLIAKAFKEGFKSTNVKGQVKKSRIVIESAGEKPHAANWEIGWMIWKKHAPCFELLRFTFEREWTSQKGRALCSSHEEVFNFMYMLCHFFRWWWSDKG